MDGAAWLGQLDATKEDLAGVRVNSSHHQAVKEVGRGLTATAWSSDGIIECVEDMSEGRFIVGVQWHPELTTGHDEVSREIFTRFVGRCAHGRENKMPAAA